MLPNFIARREFLRFLAASPLLSLRGQERPVITDPVQAFNVFDFESAARKAVPPAHFGYIATGVDDDRTLRANYEAYSRIHLRPRRLIDVSHIDTTTHLLGVKWAVPIFLCPCGSQKAFHADGELATARASSTRKTLQLLSNASTVSVEDVVHANSLPVWQQLYPSNWTVMEKIVRRAEAAGCPVLVITVDRPAGRNTETQKRFQETDSRKCIACHSPGGFSGRKPMYDGIDPGGLNLLRAAFTWDSVERIRALTRMKIALKGIETAEDAKLAVDHGIDALIVSNHGGRSEEGGRATIESLPEVVQAVRGTMPVLIDGGIRRGTDVFKALAMGATAVGIGRPYLWGLGAFGQAGVERVLDILRFEFELIMAQCGARSIADIKPAHIIRT